MVNNPNPTHRDLLNAGVAPEVELIDTTSPTAPGRIPLVRLERPLPTAGVPV